MGNLQRNSSIKANSSFKSTRSLRPCLKELFKGEFLLGNIFSRSYEGSYKTVSFKLLQAMPFRNLILFLGAEDFGSSLRIILFMVTVLNFDCLQAFAF